MNVAETTRPQRRRSRVIPVLIVIIVLLASGCTYLFVRYRQTLAKQQSTPVAQADKLANTLSKTMLLPSGQPALATVLNKSKLGNADLVAEAHNGDQLLIYAKAKRVVLYRPGTHKIVDMFHVESAAASVPATSTGARH